MGKKLIIPLTLIFLAIFFFNKKIISQIIIINSSKWMDYNLSLNIGKINIISGNLELNQVKLKNKENFFFENIFEADEIKINFSLKNFFSELVVINKVIINEPKFYFEIKNSEKKGQILDDNLNLAEKFSGKHLPKIYPKKKKDKNFIIIDLVVNNLKVIVRQPKNNQDLKINLLNMNFANIGNSGINNKKFIHYKDIMSLVLANIFYKIPDLELRELIKKNYKIK